MANETPDLASVLRTLASISSSQRSTDLHYQPYDSRLAPQSNLNIAEPDDEYEPPPAQVHTSYQEQPNPQAWNQRPAYVQQVTRPSQQQANFVDPCTIIEWSAGLRCIMKTVARNESIVQEIRKVSMYHLSLLQVLTIKDDQSPT